MTARVTSRTLLATVLGLGVVAGAGATYLALSPRTPSAPSEATLAVPPSAPARVPDATVRLSADEMVRAGITTTVVEAASLRDTITIPALVEPNAYKQTVVTALVAGRVTRVLADLGQPVQRGQTLAEVYSPELAEAQRTHISSSAELRAHEQELTRIASLVAIGSASRRELEMAHAEHAALTSKLEGSRTRLELLGLTTRQLAGLSSAAQITATTEIPAPHDGVVVLRQANVGANIDSTMPLFTVVDLSRVWVVGDLYEQDFSKVGVGQPVTVVVSGFPDLALPSTISYIDPQLSRETRTARVRAEVPNGQDRLRIGMYAQMRIRTAGDRIGPVIPKSAVQTIGDRAVVYVADPGTPGLFIERTIQAGGEAGDRVAVVSGVAIGDSVVSAGSFALRAQRERMGGSAGNTSQPATLEQPSGQARQTARITASEKGFEPARLSLQAGVPALITFVRTTDTTCAKEVVFPSLNIRRELPLGTPVVIELTPSRGELSFVCGVGMFRGTVSAK